MLYLNCLILHKKACICVFFFIDASIDAELSAVLYWYRKLMLIICNTCFFLFFSTSAFLNLSDRSIRYLPL